VGTGIGQDHDRSRPRTLCGSGPSEEGVSFQRLKTWKASKDPRYAEKKARVEQLYAVADREVTPQPGDPEVIFHTDELGR
jgi:hypothetical protein